MPRPTIKYVIGDATQPTISERPVVIAHICNDVGVFGAGFVVPLANRYPLVKSRYIEWARKGEEDGMKFELGAVQFVQVSEMLWVANMIGQKGIGMRRGAPIRYDAVDAALGKVASFCKEHNAEVAGPRFGSGLAGGKWEIIEGIINRRLCQYQIDTTIYDLKNDLKEEPEDAQPIFGW